MHSNVTFYKDQTILQKRKSIINLYCKEQFKDAVQITCH